MRDDRDRAMPTRPKFPFTRIFRQTQRLTLGVFGYRESQVGRLSFLTSISSLRKLPFCNFP